jgi:ABC-type Fe3+-hydroxamate transport system substrate-binding protein
MCRGWKYLVFCAVCLVLVTWSTVRAQQQEEAITIKDVMKEAHKKPKDLLKKVVVGGDATAEDKNRLLELYKALAANTPPKGDAASWKEKTDLLVNAAQAVVDGKEGAADQLNKAANCMGCHDLHKE